MPRAAKHEKYVVVSTVDRDADPKGREFQGPGQRPRYYSPIATKTPTLLLFLSALLICIVLLEIIVRRGSKYTPLKTFQPSTTHQARTKRQDATPSAAATSASLTVTSPTSTLSVFPSETDPAAELTLTTPTPSSKDSPSPVDSDELILIGATTITSEAFTQTDPAAELTLTTPTSSSKDSPSPIDSDELTLIGPITTPAQTDPAAELTLTSPTNTVPDTLTQTDPAAELTLTSPTATDPETSSETDPAAELTLTTPENPSTTTFFDFSVGSELTLTSPTTNTKTTAAKTKGSGLLTSPTTKTETTAAKTKGSGSLPSSKSATTVSNSASIIETAHVTTDGALLSLTSASSIHSSQSTKAHATSALTTEITVAVSAPGGSLLSLTSSLKDDAPTGGHSTSTSVNGEPTKTESAATASGSLLSLTSIDGHSGWSAQTQSVSNAGTTAFSTTPSASRSLDKLTTDVSSSQDQTASNSMSEFTTLLTTTDSSGKPTSFFLVIVESTSTAALVSATSGGDSSENVVTNTLTAAPAPASQITLTSTATLSSTTTSPEPSDPFTHSELKVKGPFTKLDYFSAMYLGPFIAVLLKVIWDITYSAIKMMEPFYQLAKPSGASAQDSLFSDYLSTGLSWHAMRATFRGHWTMVFATLIYGFVCLLAPLAAESMTVRAQSYCKTEQSDHQRCDPAWIVASLTIRILEGVLGLIILLIVALIAFHSRRKSGVFSNPSSLASMAALLSHPSVIQDIRRIDPQANSQSLSRALAGNAYKLAYHETSPGVFRYGITKTTSLPSSKASNTSLLSTYSASQYSALSTPANDPSTQNPPHSRIPWVLILDIAFLLSIFALFGIILAYYLDKHSDPFNDFFNSNTFGPRFTITLTATILDAQWKRLEREVRIMTPYRRMAKRFARPQDTILMSMNGTPLSSLPLAIWHEEWFHALVALVAVLSDVNIIAVAGVPYSDGQIRPALRASSYTSMTILGLMAVTLVGVWVWRLDCPRIPRAPDTLGSVWMYMCGSRMVEDFRHTEEVGRRVRDGAVKRSGRRYWFGWALGLDGKERWMVDFEVAGGMVAY